MVMEKQAINSSVLTDFHSHILPHCDHGSDSVSTSIKQIEMLKKSGFNNIVATPHFYPHKESVEVFLSKREESLDQLLVKANSIPVKLFLGAEVLICHGLENMDGLRELCIRGTNVLLLEMPLEKSWTKDLYDTVYNRDNDGFTVVLANTNRYPFENVARLLEYDNVFSQLNCTSVNSFKGRSVIKRSIETGKVAAVGSDIHMLDNKAVKSCEKFIKWASKYTSDIFTATNELLCEAVDFSK